MYHKVLGIMQGVSGLNDSMVAERLGVPRQRYYVLKCCKDIKLQVLISCCKACGFTLILTNRQGVSVDLLEMEESTGNLDET